jgi:ABC-type amino acid transport substrate-binding protein
MQIERFGAATLNSQPLTVLGVALKPGEKAAEVILTDEGVDRDGIFAGLEGGAYDAIFSSVTITDERKKTYNFSDPYFDANQGVVTPVDDTTIKSESDWAGKTIGAQIGTTGAIYVSDNLKETTLSHGDGNAHGKEVSLHTKPDAL